MPTTTNSVESATLVERLASEGYIGMATAAKLYGEAREGKRTHPSTPTRHALGASSCRTVGGSGSSASESAGGF